MSLKPLNPMVFVSRCQLPDRGHHACESLALAILTRRRRITCRWHAAKLTASMRKIKRSPHALLLMGLSDRLANVRSKML